MKIFYFTIKKRCNFAESQISSRQLNILPKQLKNSKSADAHYNRALAYQNENYDAAIADYTTAVMIAPEHFQAFNNRGLAFREQKKFKMRLMTSEKAPL